MAPKQTFEAVDKLLQDIMQTQTIFGDKIMVLGGDFRQILPVVRRGGRAEVVPTNNEEEIEVPEELRCRELLINEIFGPFLNKQSWDLSEAAILTPKNDVSLNTNNQVLNHMAGEKVVCRSTVSIITEGPKDMFNIPTEFLNRMTPNGFPPHELQLRIGCIVMLLRNLDLKEGLCNGTRLIIVRMGDRVLGCTFACCARKGRYALIPRIDNYYKQAIQQAILYTETKTVPNPPMFRYDHK
ncbi:hypothetical protein Aduo_009148 [Ancylostoma duodenale]